MIKGSSLLIPKNDIQINYDFLHYQTLITA
jgi:hypothetical protein